jgi:hypothetical protein
MPKQYFSMRNRFFCSVFVSCVSFSDYCINLTGFFFLFLGLVSYCSAKSATLLMLSRELYTYLYVVFLQQCIAYAAAYKIMENIKIRSQCT